MDLALLERTLAECGEPRFRARQVWAWVARGAGGYTEMTDLPAALRQALERELPFSSLSLRRQVGSRDGTVKALFQTADGRPLEAVLMRYRSGRRSICISSQSGCPLTCSFCATGSMRFARNLSASEIIDQALHFHRLEARPRDGRSRSTLPDGAAAAPLSHCVFMGMGEPLMNLENVLGACERLPDLGISHRRTTISTVGWIPAIEQLAAQQMPLRLALSVHAADEALRSQLMPVNERYPLREVIEACRAFYARKRRRVFVEYVMLAGVNDRYEQALALADVLGARHVSSRPASAIFKVNLIPYNPIGPAAIGPAPNGPAARYEGSTRQSIAAFRDALRARGVPCTVRLTRGRDIDAACGQLAAHAG